eukprot:jgi/Mesen1/1289/ME000013S00781
MGSEGNIRPSFTESPKKRRRLGGIDVAMDADLDKTQRTNLSHMCELSASPSFAKQLPDPISVHAIVSYLQHGRCKLSRRRAAVCLGRLGMEQISVFERREITADRKIALQKQLKESLRPLCHMLQHGSHRDKSASADALTALCSAGDALVEEVCGRPIISAMMSGLRSSDVSPPASLARLKLAELLTRLIRASPRAAQILISEAGAMELLVSLMVPPHLAPRQVAPGQGAPEPSAREAAAGGTASTTATTPAVATEAGAAAAAGGGGGGEGVRGAGAGSGGSAAGCARTQAALGAYAVEVVAAIASKRVHRRALVAAAPCVIPGLVAALGSPGLETRARAAHALGHLALSTRLRRETVAAGALPGLVAVRHLAADALGEAAGGEGGAGGERGVDDDVCGERSAGAVVLQAPLHGGALAVLRAPCETRDGAAEAAGAAGAAGGAGQGRGEDREGRGGPPGGRVEGEGEFGEGGEGAAGGGGVASLATVVANSRQRDVLQPHVREGARAALGQKLLAAALRKRQLLRVQLAAANTLGMLAAQPEHARAAAAAGAAPPLVDLLLRGGPPGGDTLARDVAEDALCILSADLDNAADVAGLLTAGLAAAEGESTPAGARGAAAAAHVLWKLSSYRHVMRVVPEAGAIPHLVNLLRYCPPPSAAAAGGGNGGMPPRATVGANRPGAAAAAAIAAAFAGAGGGLRAGAGFIDAAARVEEQRSRMQQVRRGQGGNGSSGGSSGGVGSGLRALSGGATGMDGGKEMVVQVEVGEGVGEGVETVVEVGVGVGVTGEEQRGKADAKDAGAKEEEENEEGHALGEAAGGEGGAGGERGVDDDVCGERSAGAVVLQAPLHGGALAVLRAPCETRDGAAEAAGAAGAAGGAGQGRGEDREGRGGPPGGRVEGEGEFGEGGEGAAGGGGVASLATVVANSRQRDVLQPHVREGARAALGQKLLAAALRKRQLLRVQLAAANTLGMLAAQPEHARAAAAAGAAPPLVDLLLRGGPPGGDTLARDVAEDALCILSADLDNAADVAGLLTAGLAAAEGESTPAGARGAAAAAHVLWKLSSYRHVMRVVPEAGAIPHLVNLLRYCPPPSAAAAGGGNGGMPPRATVGANRPGAAAAAAIAAAFAGAGGGLRAGAGFIDAAARVEEQRSRMQQVRRGQGGNGSSGGSSGGVGSGLRALSGGATGMDGGKEMVVQVEVGEGVGEGVETVVEVGVGVGVTGEEQRGKADAKDAGAKEEEENEEGRAQSLREEVEEEEDGGDGQVAGATDAVDASGLWGSDDELGALLPQFEPDFEQASSSESESESEDGYQLEARHKAAGALALLSYGESSAREILEAGGVPLLLGMLGDEVQNVQTCAAEVVANVARHAWSVSEMRRAGALRALLPARTRLLGGGAAGTDERNCAMLFAELAVLSIYQHSRMSPSDDPLRDARTRFAGK